VGGVTPKSMRVSTGIQGLDHILRGGFIPRRAYSVYGDPGAGKTTLGLHFLSAGAALGESALMITFNQPEDHVRADAASVGLAIDRVNILDLTPPPEIFSENQTYDIFSPAEVEREPLTAEISKAIRDTAPARVFVDSFGHLRTLAADLFHYRRLTQSFFQFVIRQGATVLVACDDRECGGDVDGMIHLEFTPQGRTIRILKFRGSDFSPGHHPMRLTGSGLELTLAAA
jgi:circadian clock protein KaiC